MKKYSIQELPVYKAAPPNERINLLLADKQVGAENLSVGIGVYSKGQAAEFHTHVDEEEVMVYLKGKGVMTLQDGTETPLEKGDITFVPKNESHKLRNTGAEDFVFLFIYAPQGPEKNIRSWNIVKNLQFKLEDFE
jgi:oxalate decarboxylase/phosphoglucose isomerase-like protein (cupin superfamily)